MQEYIKPSDFSEIYGIQLDTIMMFLRQNPEFRYDTVDVATGEKIILFKYKKWKEQSDKIDYIINYCQWIYYPLKEIYKTDYKIAKRLNMHIDRGVANWNNFICQRLFTLRDTLLSLKLGRMYVEFGYWGTRLVLIGRKQLIEQGKWEDVLKKLE